MLHQVQFLSDTHFSYKNKLFLDLLELCSVYLLVIYMRLEKGENGLVRNVVKLCMNFRISRFLMQLEIWNLKSQIKFLSRRFFQSLLNDRHVGEASIDNKNISPPELFLM